VISTVACRGREEEEEEEEEEEGVGGVARGDDNMLK